MGPIGVSRTWRGADLSKLLLPTPRPRCRGDGWAPAPGDPCYNHFLNGWKEIQLVHPKGNESWIFNGRTDAEAETPILWPPDVKNWLIWKDPDAGKDSRHEEKGKNRGWDGWMASLTQWTWVWVSSRSWWWTGRPGVLRSMGSQSRTWLGGWTELNWKHCHWLLFYILAHKIIVIDDAFKLMKYTTSFTERKKKPYKSKQITRQINISKMFNKI